MVLGACSFEHYIDGIESVEDEEKLKIAFFDLKENTL